MTHVIHHSFGARPRVVAGWLVGPDPEATRSQSRDLTATVEAYKLWSAAVAAEASRVAMMTDPEIKALHQDRLAEAITHARDSLDVIERIADLNHAPGAA